MRPYNILKEIQIIAKIHRHFQLSSKSIKKLHKTLSVFLQRNMKVKKMICLRLNLYCIFYIFPDNFLIK